MKTTIVSIVVTWSGRGIVWNVTTAMRTSVGDVSFNLGLQIALGKQFISKPLVHPAFRAKSDFVWMQLTIVHGKKKSMWFENKSIACNGTL